MLYTTIKLNRSSYAIVFYNNHFLKFYYPYLPKYKNQLKSLSWNPTIIMKIIKIYKNTIQWCWYLHIAYTKRWLFINLIDAWRGSKGGYLFLILNYCLYLKHYYVIITFLDENKLLQLCIQRLFIIWCISDTWRYNLLNIE